MLNWKKIELFAAWNQVPWPCKGRSKTTTGYMDGLSNQDKKLRVYYKCRDIKHAVDDAFDCDRHRVETFGMVSGF